MTPADKTAARVRMRNALIATGVPRSVAVEIAFGFDPEVMDAARYLGRMANAVERAMDAVHVASRCEVVGAGR